MKGVPKVLRWAENLTDGQVVLLATEFSRHLANPTDVDPAALRAILARFITKLPATPEPVR